MIFRKKIKKLVLVVLALLVLLNLFILVSGKFYLYKAVIYNFAGIQDHTIFPVRVISPSLSPVETPLSADPRFQPQGDFATLLEELETVSFLVMKNDTIRHEFYANGYNKNSLTNVFSVAKSYVSSLIGIALQEGKIQSLEDPVSDYLPEGWIKGSDSLKIIDVLTMSSGLNWDESYANPLSMTTEAYYGDDLASLIKELKVIQTPGLKFEYLSGNTQVLGFILVNAYKKSLAELLQEKIWQPLQIKHKALWNTDDENGMEKAYCCVGATARDMLRFGQLYNKNGFWRGTRVLDSSYIQASVIAQNYKQVAEWVNSEKFYGYQWWILTEVAGEKAFYARGILGQYIICLPKRNLVIVRKGHKRLPNKNGHPEDVYAILEFALQLPD